MTPEQNEELEQMSAISGQTGDEWAQVLNVAPAALDRLAQMCVDLTAHYDEAKVRRLALHVPALTAEVRRLRAQLDGRPEFGARCFDGHVTSCTDLLDAREEQQHLNTECRRCGGERHEVVQRTHYRSSPWSPVQPEEASREQ